MAGNDLEMDENTIVKVKTSKREYLSSILRNNIFFIKTLIILIMILLLQSVLFLSGCQKAEKVLVPEVDILASGNQAITDRNWGKAIDEFTRLIEADSTNKDAFYRRAGAYLAKAKDHYNLAEAAAQKKELSTAKTEAENADKNFILSENDAKSALQLDEKFADALYILGCVYIYQGEWNGAIDAFSKCIKVQPDNPLAWQRRGEVYEYTGDNGNAIVDLNKASSLGYKATKKSDK